MTSQSRLRSRRSKQTFSKKRRSSSNLLNLRLPMLVPIPKPRERLHQQRAKALVGHLEKSSCALSLNWQQRYSLRDGSWLIFQGIWNRLRLWRDLWITGSPVWLTDLRIKYKRSLKHGLSSYHLLPLSPKAKKLSSMESHLSFPRQQTRTCSWACHQRNAWDVYLTERSTQRLTRCTTWKTTRHPKETPSSKTACRTMRVRRTRTEIECFSTIQHSTIRQMESNGGHLLSGWKMTI